LPRPDDRPHRALYQLRGRRPPRRSRSHPARSCLTRKALMAGSTEPVLSIRDLTVEFKTEDGIVHAVDGVTYDVFPGETLGIVGESGSGKSVSMLAVLGLIPQPPGRIVKGEAVYKGRDVMGMSKGELRRLRGGDMA